MKKQSPNKYYRIGLKNLAKQRKVLDGLDKYCDEFSKWQMGSVIKLQTFHVIMAVRIIQDALPFLKNDNNKEAHRLKRKIK